jgi:HK97 family phage major capsid protein
MATFSDVINRDVSDDPLVPTPVAAQIIQELPTMSAVLSLARKVPMSTKTNRQPVLSLLPSAYFVSGDTGLKQTTKQDWENLTLVAEEMAVIVPIPQAYLDDAQVPIWDEVRPRIVEAFGYKIDAATLFAIDKPATWGDAVVPHAVTAGNFVVEGTKADLAADIAALALKVDQDGFNVNGFVTQPGFTWRLIGMRSVQGFPIYQPNLVDGQPNTLFGKPLPDVDNGAWDGHSVLIAGDWTKAIVGTRQDITFRVFTEGVITDSNGAVVLNLMQQDAVALRAVIRLGWQLANPATRLNPTKSTRSPFGVLETLGAS